MRLSERLGIVQARAVMQGRELDTATRNRLWSCFAEAVPAVNNIDIRRTWMFALYQHIWADYFKLPLDELPSNEFQIRELLKAQVLSSQWYEAYEFLEFVLDSKHNGNQDRLLRGVDGVLREEMAGFRLIDAQFVEITDEREIAAIEEAIEATSDVFSPARLHLSASLAFLSDRRTPDYRNSVKESISAVEAVVQILTGEPSAELGKALTLLSDRIPIHGAFESALRKLYGFTSDAQGIRHALSEAPTLDATDAKFMLVTCAAFVMYLISKGASLVARPAT